MRRLQRAANQLNEEFREAVTEEMRTRFGVEVENRFDIFGSFRLITTRTDGEAFTPEQHAFLTGYSEGYGAALQKIRDADREDELRRLDKAEAGAF